jgi:glycosyltransferase involved in cell wall biosynthesis
MIKKIAIDAGPLKSGHAVRGIGFHTKELLAAIEKVKVNFKDIEIFPVDFSKENLKKYSLAHFTSFNPYFMSLPFIKPTRKTVLTIHDLIYLVFPDKYPAGIKGKIKFFIQKILIRSVDAIITISNVSKADIVKFLKIDPQKVSVIHLAAKVGFKKISNENILKEVKEKYSLPDKFVLYVGDVNYNKNIPNLVKACKIAGVPLVIVGKQALGVEEGGMTLKDIHGPKDWLRFVFGAAHPELAHYSKLAEEFKKNQEVRRLGFVPDNDLVAIYNLASLYCQPSYYEGFGLPLLEAMICETPVAASKIKAHEEIGGGACEYFDPRSPDDMAKVIQSVINDSSLRNKLIKLGRVQVKKYSWEKTAEETINVYEKVLEG